MKIKAVFVAVAVMAATLGVGSVAGAGPSGNGPTDRSALEYWTAERIATAQPRDMVVDERGRGYRVGQGGELIPHGHTVAAERHGVTATRVPGAQRAPRPSSSPAPMATTVSSLSPDGVTVGASASFTAVVETDARIRSVTMYVGRVGSAKQSFSMSFVGGDVWQANLQGFSDGDWEWYVEARERGGRGARVVSSTASFTVDTGGGGGGGNVVNERWTGGGDVQTAAGRILFTMPGGDFVCSGTVATDATTGRSVIISAAHCIYDDVNKVFASNAIFIPNQDQTSGSATDDDCSNDPLGCWVVDHGVVDINWTTRTFPDNIPWDYGYYVVADSGASDGPAPSPILDQAAGSMTVDFGIPSVGQTGTALGYSYSDDPFFMHCQEPLAALDSANYWLGSCDLSGGSSGGPWLQPLDGGNGLIMSVNSWGYSNQPGMAGPKLHDNSASLLFEVAKQTSLSSADRGFVVDPSSPPTTTTTVPPTTTTEAPEGSS